MKHCFIRIVVLIATVLVMLTVAPEASQKFPTEAKRVISAYNDFGFQLLKKLASKASDRNIFISPSSLAIALTIAYNGAVGETKEAMARVMALEGISDDDINRANAEIRQLLQKLDPKTELLIANALWLREGINFREEFLTLTRKFFDAELDKLTTEKPINDWVALKTKGKITHLIDRNQITPLIVLVITNAIYFKGLWRRPFEKRLTKPKDFYLPTGARVKVPMMSQSGRFLYLRGKGFQAVCLPYGETGRLEFCLFVPDKGKSLADFLQALNCQNWEDWMAKFRLTEGNVRMPRFKVEYGTISLKELLSDMTMRIAFTEGSANFSKIAFGIWIDDVLHKAVIEVNEEGTEAVGGTAVLFKGLLMPERFTLIADRPFFFAIRDTLTGLVLFAGILNKP